MRAIGNIPAAEALLQELESFAIYDKINGGFVVIHSNRGHRPAIGQALGCKTNKGYLYTQLQGQRYPVHHLVWLWHFGRLPKQLDHINRDKADNRIENLREACNTLNNLNKGAQSNNVLGLKNIRKLPSGNYQVRVLGNNLGVFATVNEARQTRDTYNQRQESCYVCS